MKKVLIIGAIASLLSGCASTEPTGSLEPNIWRQEKMGKVAGCNVTRTIMSHNWRLYVIHCGYQKDRRDPIQAFAPGGNCRLERDEYRRLQFGHYSYTISCTGKLADQRKPGDPLPKGIL